MLKNNALHHLIVQKILAKPGDASQGAKLLAATAAEGWCRMAAKVAPIIGVKGVHALYVRSLYLSSKVYPCLAAVEIGQDDAPFAKLETQLAACSSKEAIAAANTLFLNFIELLAPLIGESLTEQLLQAAWRDALPPAPECQRQIDHYEQ
jgi:hypothetical protein